MSNVIPFKNPCGRTQNGTRDEVENDAFWKFYSEERQQHTDPVKAYELATQHILYRFANEVTEDIREAMKEV